NSNRYLIGALLKKWGITPYNIKHIPDDRHLMLETFRKAMDADILIISGAVSAGDADFVPGVLEELGVKKLFHKLAIKPGKPMWCGQMRTGGMVFALPGNPFSSLVTFLLMIEDYLYRCFGLPEPVLLALPLNGQRQKKSTLDEFFPVRIGGNPIAAIPVFFNSSGDILAALQADGLAWQPASTQSLENGNVVQVFKF
ncbi:MAG: molybdopterin-binding protein, partial [Chitinophagaceae bacterium]